MKKILALILAFTLVFGLCLASCTEKDGDNSSDSSDTKKGALILEESELLDYYQSIESTAEEQLTKDELDKELLAVVNGLPIYASSVRYTTMALNGYPEEEAKVEEEKFFKENAALLETAFENGVEFTEQNATKLKADITGMQLQLGDEYDSVFAETPYTQFFYYFQTSVYSSIYSNLFEKIASDRENEMTKAAFEEAKSDMVRAKHILIQFPQGEGENGALTDEQKANTLSRAEAVLAEVNAMEDISKFDDLIATYNEDPGMEANPDGYYFGKGEMVPEFEEAAYALEEGKTSGLVETSYGYHILLKLPLEDDEAIYNSGAFTNLLSTKLYDSISEKTEDMEIVYSENYGERVDDFNAEYEALMATLEAPETETAPEAEVETETDVEAEAETAPEAE